MLKEGRILSVFSWKWEWNKITYGWVGDKIMYKRLTMDLRMQKVSRIFSYPTKQESASRILSIRKHVEGHSFPERKQIIINVRQLTRSRCKQCWAHYNLITSLPLAFLFESLFSLLSLAVLKQPRVVASASDVYFIWSKYITSDQISHCIQ